jgi:hypothetical protein
MKGLQVVKVPVVTAICLGLAMPVSAGQAGEERKAPTRPAVELADVVLDAQGGLQGLVVDMHGVPQSGAKVLVVHKKREVGRVWTDRLGRFRLAGLRGGVYMLQSGGQGRFVRVWTTEAAPPTAKQIVSMVTGDGVVRGQMPLENFFASDAVVIAGLVAAMIAIPIAVSNQGGDSSPASP